MQKLAGLQSNSPICIEMHLLWKWLLRVRFPGPIVSAHCYKFYDFANCVNKEVKELESWQVEIQTILLWSPCQLLHDAVLLELAVLCNSENGLQAS